MRREVGKACIEVALGDITREEVDAVVNAANTSLLGGGGVDGAIHRAGGPEILAECKTLDGCETGDAKATTAGKMPARRVIHTVGPVYRDGLHGEPELLASCCRRSLEVATENGLHTVSFPAISCGVYGYPLDDAAKIAIATVQEFLATNDSVDIVRFVLFTHDAYAAFERALSAL